MSKDAALDGSGDFRDRSLAVAISVALHVAAFGWMWFVRDQAGWGKSEVSWHSGRDGTSADFLAPDEFRQRIEVKPALASPDIPDTSERPLNSEENLPADHVIDTPEVAEFVPSAEHSTPDVAPVQNDEVVPTESIEADLAQGGENGGGNSDDGLRAAYLAALRAAIRQHWNYQGPGQQCNLTIKQSPGGAVQSAVAGSCALTPQERRSLEAAALMAQPLPYEEFERVFSETTILSIE